MGDSTAAARYVRKTLAADGTWMVVEPFAGDKLEENLHPLGRVFHAASTRLCVPNSMASEGVAWPRMRWLAAWPPAVRG